MVIAGIPREEIRHTRAVQDWLAEGRQDGRQGEAASMPLRLLNRRCSPLTDATTTQIQRPCPWSNWKPWLATWLAAGDVLVNVDNVSKRFGRSLQRSLWTDLQDVAMAGGAACRRAAPMGRCGRMRSGR